MSDTSIDTVLRESAPYVLGALTHRYGDFAAAEDAVQEALLAASTQWTRDGPPDSARAWLMRVASRRLIDQIRTETARRAREEAANENPDSPIALDEDDSLTVLLLCCHPSLSTTSSVALTLRAVGGLTTAEIARAYFVPESTMAQRISRAKQQIKNVDMSLAGLSTTQRAQSVRRALQVLYLIFNEGYVATAGPDLERTDLSEESIRLTRWLARLLPDEPEVLGLLALMLLTDARKPARTDANNDLVSLADQDRTLWSSELIEEGSALIARALPSGAVGPYQLQAAIAALHDEAPDADATDWAQIDALYAVLERMVPNPVVTLNRSVATAMLHGPGAGHSMLDSIADAPQLARTHRVDALRAHLYEMGGDLVPAVRHYRAAAAKTTSLPEQRYLMKRAALVDRRDS